MIKIASIIALFLSASFLNVRARADELSKPDKEAMDKTIELMNNPAERAKVIQKDSNLQKVDKDVEVLGGSAQNKEAMYKAASKIFQDMVKNANGDADKMKELMEQAQRDPQKFMEGLSGANQDLIRGIANDIEKSKVDTKTP